MLLLCMCSLLVQYMPYALAWSDPRRIPNSLDRHHEVMSRVVLPVGEIACRPQVRVEWHQSVRRAENEGVCSRQQQLLRTRETVENDSLYIRQ